MTLPKKSLREKQSVFATAVARLILRANEIGYKVTLGEAWRSPEEAQRRGFPNSLHADRLAIDLNLFLEGKYLKETNEYKLLGIWWERQHPDFRWGGRFDDGNHFSMEHEGVK